MTQSKFSLRELRAEDAPAFWNLRLQGLQEEVDAFTSSYEESRQRPQADVEESLQPTENSFVLGLFAENKLVGMAGFRRGNESYKVRHKGLIWGVYVRPEHRGLGLAKRLLLAAIEKSRSLGGIELVQLGVNAANLPVKKLYESVGFKSWGCEKHALKLADHYVDEERMMLFV